MGTAQTIALALVLATITGAALLLTWSGFARGGGKVRAERRLSRAIDIAWPVSVTLAYFLGVGVLILQGSIMHILP